MDLALKEMGSTLLVGLFTVLAADAFVVYLLGSRLIGFFDGRIGFSGSENTKTKAGLLVAVSFASGLLAEDISYRFVDDRGNPAVATAILAADSLDALEPSAPAFTRHRPVSRRDFRAHTLLNHSVSPDWPLERVVPTALGAELGELGSFKALGGSEAGRAGAAIDGWLSSRGPYLIPVACLGTIEDAIERLYYQAKNTVFLEPTLFEEMRAVELKLDFARSISLIAYCFLVSCLCLWAGRVAILYSLHRRPHMSPHLAVFYGLSFAAFFVAVLLTRAEHRAVIVYIAAVAGVMSVLAVFDGTTRPALEHGTVAGRLARWPFLLWLAGRSHTSASRPSRAQALVDRRIRARLYQCCWITLILVACYGAGVVAYWRQQEEFDKRAFGYFVTLQRKAGRSAPVDAAVPLLSAACRPPLALLPVASDGDSDASR